MNTEIGRFQNQFRLPARFSTYFPLVDDRYVDGGVGSYGNPCYIAAYEAKECLNWDPMDTTLISIGTGRSPYKYETRKAKKLWAWDWIGPVMGVFTQSAFDQQAHLVNTYFQKMDFRRFQIDLRETIEMDEANQNDRLLHMALDLAVDLSDRCRILLPGNVYQAPRLFLNLHSLPWGKSRHKLNTSILKTALKGLLERAMGFEPTNISLEGVRLTTWRRPHHANIIIHALCLGK